MVNNLRRSIDFGSFTYWKSRPASAAQYAEDNIDQLAVESRQQVKRKCRKHHHRDVSMDMPPGERAQIVIQKMIDEEKQGLAHSSSTSDSQLSDFEAAAKQLSEFMEKFAQSCSDEVDNGEENEVKGHAHPLDVERLEVQRQLLSLSESYQKEIAAWQRVLGGLPTTPNGDGTARVKELETGMAEVDEVHSDVREAAITLCVHADAVQRDLKRLTEEDRALQSRVRALAWSINAHHNQNRG